MFEQHDTFVSLQIFVTVLVSSLCVSYPGELHAMITRRLFLKETKQVGKMDYLCFLARKNCFHRPSGKGLQQQQLIYRKELFRTNRNGAKYFSQSQFMP